MNEIAELGKFFIAIVIRTTLNIIFRIMPLHKKRILFDSFIGKQYSCNPRALYEYMLKYFPSDYEFIWAFKEPSKYSYLKNNGRTLICKYRSLKHYYYSSTSSIIIFNFTRTNELPYRNKQIRLQTWHGGGCYKKTGQSIQYNSKIHNWILSQKSKIDSTHFISSSKYFSSEVISGQYKFKGFIFETGMPRNDCFFQPKEMQTRNRIVRKKYSIKKTDFIVLYAPTFKDREIKDIELLNFVSLKEVVSQKFNKNVIIIYRGHHFENKNLNYIPDIDASDYFDMQDLLIAADMLITDYSSSIWDFSFTLKPCFLYTPDLDSYQIYRGFDKDIYQWGFPVCKTNKLLQNTIKKFDQNLYELSMQQHHTDLNSFEKGNACQKICAFIKNYNE